MLALLVEIGYTAATTWYVDEHLLDSSTEKNNHSNNELLKKIKHPFERQILKCLVDVDFTYFCHKIARFHFFLLVPLKSTHGNILSLSGVFLPTYP